MFKSLTINSLLPTIFRFRIISAGFILCAALLSLEATSASAQVKIGSVVNLQNQYKERQSYLDTRGRVMDKSEFAGVAENVFVSTNDGADRDKGSGSWKIVSATGKKDGDPLMFGDAIHLSNMYTGAGFLDVWTKELDIFKKTLVKPDETDYAVFASTSKNRENGSGTWIVRKPDKPAETSEVKENEVITLESKRFPGLYLETNGAVGTTSLPFKEYKEGTRFLVFVTDSKGFHSGSERWKVTLKK